MSIAIGIIVGGLLFVSYLIGYARGGNYVYKQQRNAANAEIKRLEDLYSLTVSREELKKQKALLVKRNKQYAQKPERPKGSYFNEGQEYKENIYPTKRYKK